jgi:hypothetical protein
MTANTTATTAAITMPIDLDDLLTEAAPIYHRYPNQTAPQPGYIELDEDGNVTYDYDGAIGYAVPIDVWDGRTIRWTLPGDIRGKTLHRLLTVKLPGLLERVHAGHSVEWDGSNHVGRLDDDASAARAEIERILADLHDDDRAAVYDVDDWVFGDGGLRSAWPTTQTIDEAVAALTEEAERQKRLDGVVVDGNILTALLKRAGDDYDHGHPLGRVHLQALVDAGEIDQADADAYDRIAG